MIVAAISVRLSWELDLLHCFFPKFPITPPVFLVLEMEKKTIHQTQNHLPTLDACESSTILLASEQKLSDLWVSEVFINQIHLCSIHPSINEGMGFVFLFFNTTNQTYQLITIILTCANSRSVVASSFNKMTSDLREYLKYNYTLQVHYYYYYHYFAQINNQNGLMLSHHQ